MSDHIVMQREMVRYLAYQRPAYKGLTPEAAGTLVQAEITNFLRVNASWLDKLPRTSLRVLDIGAGLGFGALAVSKHLESTSKFTIIDKSRVTENLFYGFEKEAAAYNDLSLSQKFLTTNGIDADRLTTVDIEKESFPKGEFDFILSCISWGFHYPVSTYIDDVKRCLASGGVIYIDLRQGTDGQSELEKAGFQMIWTKEHRITISSLWKKK